MNLHQASSKRQRYHILDLLRGFLFVNMAAYHFLYDWTFMFGQNCPFMRTHAAYIWQQLVCSGFILLAGCSFTLSRHPAKHGVRIFLCGMLVTLVTCIVTPEEQILFGILHFIGLAYILTALFRPFSEKIPKPLLCFVFLALFAFTRGIYYGYFGFFLWEFITLPDSLYQYSGLFLIGLPDQNFTSADYFPLIPWLFLFWTAASAAPFLLKNRSFLRIQHCKLPLFNWIGHNTLLLYMLHQPVIFGILSLLFS